MHLCGTKNSCPAESNLGMEICHIARVNPGIFSTFYQQSKSHLCLQNETETNRNHENQALIKGARTKSQFEYDPHETRFSFF